MKTYQFCMSVLFVVCSGLLSAQTLTEFKITADTISISANFGGSVDIDGDYVVVGALHDSSGSNADVGSAFIFRWDGSTWVQEAKLTASDGATDSHFGRSVAIDTNYVIVGAYRDSVGNIDNQGAAYIFKRTGSSWAQEAKLTATESDGPLPDSSSGDRFGTSVDIDGDYAIVGAYLDDPDSVRSAGSAYVFKRSGTTWNQVAKLTSSAMYDSATFGRSVAISGGLAVVGEPVGEFVNQKDSAGAAFVFARNNGGVDNWGADSTLTASDGSAGDRFGRSVSIDGSLVVVGVSNDSLTEGAGAGSAYIYKKSGTWTEKDHITASDRAGGDKFGTSVAVSGEKVIVGAPRNDEGGASSGSAYGFEKQVSGFVQSDSLVASDAAAGDNYGFSVSINGQRLIVGSVNDGPSGSAYIYMDTTTSALVFYPVDGLAESSVTSANIPETTFLGRNYPNPFNPTTRIQYGLHERGLVTLKVYNMLGQEVKTLVNRIQIAGFHETIWDGRNTTGSSVASGIYILKLSTATTVESRKILLAR